MGVRVVMQIVRALGPVRPQAPLVADVRQVQLMMEPLMSYHPFWLRVGLLTVLRGGGGGEGPEGGGRRGLQALVREGLLLEKDMQAASDKQALWVRFSQSSVLVRNRRPVFLNPNILNLDAPQPVSFLNSAVEMQMAVLQLRGGPDPM